MSENNNKELQSPDIPFQTMISRYEAIKAVHIKRGSFISETCHYVSPIEDLPFYFTEKTEPHLNVRPLRREERRHIHEIKKRFAKQHAEQLTMVLDKFNEMEILEGIANELAKGRILK